MHSFFRISLIVILSSAFCGKVYAQHMGSGFTASVGLTYPTTRYASEAFKPGWAVKGAGFAGADFINVQFTGGFEMWHLKEYAYSTDPFMDSIIRDGGGDPVSHTFVGLGIEAGTPANFPVRLSALMEGNVGLYFGRAAYVLRQLKRDPMNHVIHWAGGFGLSARLDFRLSQTEETATFFFVKYEYRGLAAQLENNRFNGIQIGLAMWTFD